MSTVTFFVPGDPKPQGSKRAFVIKGHAVLTESAGAPLRDWRTAVAMVAREHCREPLGGPLAVSITFYLKRPKALPKKVLHPATRPDIDKLLRATLDALVTGGAFYDDGQVWDLRAVKQYDTRTGADITIEPDVREV